ncbi:MAG: phosphohydrolase [Candidatus Schekmanbacteria bacterium RBG_13_48_7]|uniref:Phosphohydrolase n=1 Tax=Candidatus Schekmanbacteria bacterium RBG_13_48_7 TaxID=1817878 RepID=A0A1F7RUE2_9BACT|nr:MAG: phosphohydrolase [Candidatus Schekmanbacteria bacterium RBG_13_48_7]
MNRDKALELMKSNVKNKNLRKHIFAVESVMKHLARRFKEDEEKWGLVGLLHDLDYEKTVNDPDNHAVKTVEMLKEYNLPEDMISAILAHNKKAPIQSNLEKAIYCADPVTGMIVACALIHPDKNLDPIDPEFVIRRMGEKRFAASVNREAIMSCESLNLSLEQFIRISLDAMLEIRNELGL